MWKNQPSYDVATVEQRLQRWSLHDAALRDTDTPVLMEPPHDDPRQGRSAVRPRIVHLTHIGAYLRPAPDVLYAYTLPELADRTLAVLCGERRADVGPYRGYRMLGQAVDPAHALRKLRGFRAAQLVSNIHARCLDPVRFHSTGLELSKDDILNAFARGLLGDRTRAAVETLASSLHDIRLLDQYQPGIGTSTARWMQYLAREALDAATLQVGEYTPADKRDLRAALHTIQGTVTAADRFTALSHGVPQND